MNFFVLYIPYMHLLKAILYNIFSTHTFCNPSHEVSVEFFQVLCQYLKRFR